MKKTKKKIIKNKRIQVLKGTPISLSGALRKKTEKPSLKKVTRRNLEEKIRQQTDDLQIRSGQIEEGAGREKIAEDKIRRQKDDLKIRRGQIKEGAGREKIAEEQIRIRTKAMEATLDGIFIIDAKNDEYPVIYANPAFQVLTGYTKSEISGQNYFLLYGPDADLRVAKEIKRTMRLGKSFHGEMLNFKKNGRKYWSSLRIAPIRDLKGITTHYVGTQTDITLMKQKVLEIEEQREELLHVTRVGKLAEFVSSLAHEISQPLTAILSYAQALQRMFAGREPKLQEILEYIISDDQRAVEVIRRLRSLLKKTKPTFEPININMLIKDTVALIMMNITARKKVVKFDLNQKLPIIHGDRIQLQQVLLNLISNSLEAMEGQRDSREFLIRTSLKEAGTIQVEVQDWGCGIPTENLNKLFAHFFTSKPDGLGMGLSISRSIVEAHGGRLEGKNNHDRGATFYFTIPVNVKREL